MENREQPTASVFKFNDLKNYLIEAAKGNDKLIAKLQDLTIGYADIGTKNICCFGLLINHNNDAKFVEATGAQKLLPYFKSLSDNEYVDIFFTSVFIDMISYYEEGEDVIPINTTTGKESPISPNWKRGVDWVADFTKIKFRKLFVAYFIPSQKLISESNSVDLKRFLNNKLGNDIDKPFVLEGELPSISYDI